MYIINRLWILKANNLNQDIIIEFIKPNFIDHKKNRKFQLLLNEHVVVYDSPFVQFAPKKCN